jgi:peptidoglycan/LPS O-acetylase OafA/YrhL
MFKPQIPLSHPPGAGRYLTLDAMRGIAAIMVLFRHAPVSFGGPDFPQSYLAVDLFFVMSGFVIANAYEDRLRSGGIDWIGFMRLRIIRLWPLYFVGTLAGAASYLLSQHYIHGAQVADSARTFSLIFGLAVFMLPSVVTNLFYPLNPPGWSLLFEILSNFVYGKYHRSLANDRLLKIALVAGMLLVAKSIYSNGIDSGNRWQSIYMACARVAFSFSVGILLFRFRRATRRTSDLHAIVAIALSVAVLGTPLSNAMGGVLAIAKTLVVIPALVYFAASFEPSWRFRWVFSQSGNISYGLYVIHMPLFLLAECVLVHIYRVDLQALPWLAVLVPLLIILVALLDRFYDAPLRRWAVSRGNRNLQPELRSAVIERFEGQQ